MDQMDVLPDDVLLEISDSYVDKSPWHVGTQSGVSKAAVEAWQLLIHVCRRWRGLVLGSPHRLNLRLYCTYKTPIKDRLDVWPAFPLVADWGDLLGLFSDTDNTIAALRQSNRICQVNVYLVGRHFKKALAAMRVPFPWLADLRVSSPAGGVPPTIPKSFLGGSAPRLQSLSLQGTLFPGLPKLLLTATHLVELRLINVPYSGYISPEALVAIISVLSRLRILSIDFESHHSHSASGRQSQSPPLPKRSILPALDTFHFTGVSEYLDDFVTLIDTPQLDEMDISFNQIDFDISHLAQFIDRSPTLRVRDEARVQISYSVASVELLTQSGAIKIRNPNRQPGRQLSSVVQVFNSLMYLLSSVEDLYIVHRHRQLVDAIENAHWLQLLLPFTAVKNLYLSVASAPGIAAALRELVGGRITEVLPSLQNIFVEQLELSGPFQEIIGQFVTARQLSDHTVPVSIFNYSHGTSTQ